MKRRTKSLIWGGIVGTLFYGPGAGTVLGAAWAAREHERRNRRDPSSDEEIEAALRDER